MSVRHFAGWDFEAIGSIEPERDTMGAYVELLPQMRFRDAATARLHAYGAGPFCRFRIAARRREPGLYVLTFNDTAVYAGECVNLEKRWGPNGYGGISPRNCFDGGQPTNCRINAAILAATRSGGRVELWFWPFDGDTVSRRAAEAQLIGALQPAWNRTRAP